jgi:hypothetical protein
MEEEPTGKSASFKVLIRFTHPQFAVVDDGLLIIFLNIIREVVDGDIIVLDIFHNLAKRMRN